MELAQLQKLYIKMMHKYGGGGGVMFLKQTKKHGKVL